MKKYNILSILTIAIASLFIGCNDSYQLYHEDKVVIPPKGTMVKMMTYNIYGARATNPSNAADLNALAEVIKAQDPDFVALQEIDVFTNRTGKNVHQARDLAKLLDMNWHFTKAIDRDGGQYGDAILSKYEILETKDYHLPVTAELSGENRSVCLIKVKIESEEEGVEPQEIYVGSTHLDHLADESNRVLQANELKKIIEKDIDLPIILGADLNAQPDSKPLKIIETYLTFGCTNCDFTFPSDNPNKTIDYIMYRPIEQFVVYNYSVIDERKASDHRPVVSLIKIKDKEGDEMDKKK